MSFLIIKKDPELQFLDESEEGRQVLLQNDKTP